MAQAGDCVAAREGDLVVHDLRLLTDLVQDLTAKVAEVRNVRHGDVFEDCVLLYLKISGLARRTV
jgi:hypothetical protein